MITQEPLRAERPAKQLLDILLAEDNPVNQKLAVRLLKSAATRSPSSTTDGKPSTPLERHV